MEDLIQQAQENQEQSIPVLFSLSVWKQDNQSIKDWLIIPKLQPLQISSISSTN